MIVQLRFPLGHRVLHLGEDFELIQTPLHVTLGSPEVLQQNGTGIKLSSLLALISSLVAMNNRFHCS